MSFCRSKPINVFVLSGWSTVQLSLAERTLRYRKRLGAYPHRASRSGRQACTSVPAEGRQPGVPHYPRIPKKAWNFGWSSVYTEELETAMSVWPAWGWTGRNLQMTGEHFEYVTNIISQNGNGISEGYSFGVRVWGQPPKKGLSSLMVGGGRWAFSQSWVLGALQCSQLGSEKGPTTLKLSFTDFTEFMFNQMDLLFK